MYVDRREIDLQYSNWQSGYPIDASNNEECVIFTQHHQWHTLGCGYEQKYVCQS